MIRRTLIVAAPAALVAIAACSHNPPAVALAPQPAVDTTHHAPPPLPARDTMAARMSHADSVRAQILNDSAMMAARAASGLPAGEDSILTAKIHFGFDSSLLSDSAKATLDQKVRLLRVNDKLRVEISGHADERGSDEYNLALGLRRAAAAKAYLTAYGVSGDRITIISYGSERPVDTAANEAAWALSFRIWARTESACEVRAAMVSRGAGAGIGAR